MKLEFSEEIFKKAQISNFMKIRLLGAEFFMWTDRQTDGHGGPNIGFRNFMDALNTKGTYFCIPMATMVTRIATV